MSMRWASEVNDSAELCLASSAIRWSFVEMDSNAGDPALPPGSDAPAIVPSSRPRSGTRFPPRGPVGRVPRSQRYYQVLRLPVAPPAALIFFARRYCPVFTRSLPRSREHAAASAGFWSSVPRPISQAETTGPHGFLGDPDARAPRSPTPVGPPRQASTALRLGRHLWNGDDSPLCVLSGLCHAARVLAVYASQAGSPLRHARLASGWWPPSPGRDSPPPGPHERFPATSATSCLPPLPGFARRTPRNPGNSTGARTGL